MQAAATFFNHLLTINLHNPLVLCKFMLHVAVIVTSAPPAL